MRHVTLSSDFEDGFGGFLTIKSVFQDQSSVALDGIDRVPKLVDQPPQDLFGIFCLWGSLRTPVAAE